MAFEYQKPEHLSKFIFSSFQNFDHIEQTVIGEYKEYKVLTQYEWSKGNPQHVEMSTAQCAAQLVSFEPSSVASRPREKNKSSFQRNDLTNIEYRYQVKWLKCVENMIEAAGAAPSNVVKLGLPVV